MFSFSRREFPCLNLIKLIQCSLLFINELTDKKIMDMPTCGIFAIRIHSKSWKDFATATKDFWFFDFPKAEE